MRVLMTRPLEDAQHLAEKLAARGIDVVSAPLLEIVYNADESLDLKGVQALLFTSVNGVRAFSRRSKERFLLVLCVGDATAQEAKIAHFKSIKSAAGNVEGLAELVKRELQPNQGTLLHPAGSNVAGDLGAAVQAANFVYRRAVLYRAIKAQILPESAKIALRSGGLDGILLYSPRTAQALAKLVQEADLILALRTVTAFCLSSAVAQSIADLGWAEIKIAAQPEQDALLALL